MGRPERPVNAHGGAVAQFALELRALRQAAGNPSYRDMAAATHYSPASLARAASGNALPSLAVTLAYVQACGGDPADWRTRWLCTRTQVEPTPQEAGNRDTRVGRVWWRTARLKWAAVVTVAVAVGAVGAVLIGDAHQPATVAVTTPTGPYDQTVGPGCPHTALARITQDDFTQTHRWNQATAARWQVAGCSNLIVYSQPTASANPDRWQDDYEWYFDNVPKTRQCAFHIYIPNSPYSRYTAAYDWTAGDSNYLESTTFVIDQSAYLGQWYDQGPYVFATGQAMMMITDARSGVPDAPLTAAVVRLTCT